MSQFLPTPAIKDTPFGSLEAADWTNFLPVGTVLPVVDTDAPDGWLLCNGGEHLDADYPALALKMHKFESKWPVADYSDKFLVPDLRGRTLIGQNTADYATDVWATGGSKDSHLPSHTHPVVGSTASDGSHRHGGGGATTQGAFEVNGNQILGIHGGVTGAGGMNPWQFQNNVGSPLSVNATYSAHSHSMNFTSGNAGSDGSNQNLQPYFALLYIIKA